MSVYQKTVLSNGLRIVTSEMPHTRSGVSASLSVLDQGMSFPNRRDHHILWSISVSRALRDGLHPKKSPRLSMVLAVSSMVEPIRS